MSQPKLVSKSKPQKKIHNRFDQYQICHVFTQSTQQFIQQKSQPIQSKFILKCILGTLLAINAYLSHWGPWKWPDNYYIILFSVVFYYTVSTIYTKLNPVQNCEGNLIGEYDYNGQKRIFTMNIGESKMDYVLEILDSQTKTSLGKKTFVYYQYFTEKGLFLEDRYHQNLSVFIQTIKK